MNLKDHPRVCGEHAGAAEVPIEIRGSSPRMRGAQHADEKELIAGGIIPAYAGSTTLSRIGSSQLKDHPRVCGEHLLM